MNIFYLDKNLKRCSQYMIDKHICKQIIETAQLLCAAIIILDKKETPYKLTHQNHPCAKWVRESKQNFKWLCLLGLEMCKEYSFRYNKIHKTQQVIKWCLNNVPINITNNKFSDPPLCMNEVYKNNFDKIGSYRIYYINEKQFNKSGKNMFKWTNREKPNWIKEIK